MSLTWPIWNLALRRNIYPVLAVRHPYDVARSLWIRDAMPMPVGMALWEHYLCSAIRGLGEQDVQIVHYGALVEQPGEALRWLAELLDATGADNSFKRAENACDRVLESETATRGTDDRAAASVLTQFQQQLWSTLEAKRNGSCFRASDLRELFQISEAARDSLVRFGERSKTIHAQSEQIQSFTASAEEQRKATRALQDAESRAEQRAVKLAEELARTNQELSRAAERVESQNNVIAQAEKRHANETRQAAAALDDAIGDLTARHDEAIRDLTGGHDEAIRDLSAGHDAAVSDLASQVDHAQLERASLLTRVANLEAENRDLSEQSLRLDAEVSDVRLRLDRELESNRDLLDLLAAEQAEVVAARRGSDHLASELDQARSRLAYVEVSLEQVRASAAETSMRHREALMTREMVVGELERLKATSMPISVHEDRMTEFRAEVHDLGTAMHLMHESSTWRVGRVIVGPFVWLKNLVTRAGS